MEGQFEVVWQLSGRTGVTVVCQVFGGDGRWMLTITHGADTVLSEPFTDRDSALKMAASYVKGLVGSGWKLIPPAAVRNAR